MIVLLDTSEDLDVCEAELGCPVGQLLSPLTRFTRRSDLYAIDNGGFSGFKADAFDALLKREFNSRHHCKFVALPDVVGSARRTLECFDYWADKLGTYWPLALVAQDGQENLPIEWHRIAAVFIGGSTHWKMSNAALDIVKAAKILGKWVHIGRINEPGRYEHFFGLADSCDGSGIAQYSAQRVRLLRRVNHPKLFESSEVKE